VRSGKSVGLFVARFAQRDDAVEHHRAWLRVLIDYEVPDPLELPTRSHSRSCKARFDSRSVHDLERLRIDVLEEVLAAFFGLRDLE
jgi:hypothetical protein